MRIQLVGKDGYVIPSQKRDPVVAIATGMMGNKIFPGNCTWGNMYGEYTTAHLMLKKGWGEGKTEKDIVEGVTTLLHRHDSLFMTKEGKCWGVDISGHTPCFLPYLDFFEKETDILKFFKKTSEKRENTSERRDVIVWENSQGNKVLTGDKWIFSLDGSYWQSCILGGVKFLNFRCESCGRFGATKRPNRTWCCDNRECHEIYLPKELGGIKEDIKKAYPARIY